ncbi:MAG: winged helix-turn-helix transcriptional regulator [Chloroflexi bacterium]|nr:winged helix-turn-helix transcriptional regulator [Chloroflexota bacterium]
MDSYPRSEEDFKLWVLLEHTADAMARARQKELRQCGLTNSRSAVLYSVKHIGPKPTPAEVSRWLFREPHTISALLDRMEGEGLVKKVNDLERKNQIRISMTDKGQRAYQTSLKRESIQKIVSCLSEEQREQLRTCLRLLRQNAMKELGR